MYSIINMKFLPLIVVVVLGLTTYARNGVWIDKATTWGDAATKSPGKSRPHNNLGSALWNSGDKAGGIFEIVKSAELPRTLPETHYNLANIYKAQGNLKRAAIEYRLAIDLRPDYAEAHNNLGVTFGQGGFPELAIARIKKAIAYNPNVPAFHYNLGVTYQAQGRNADADKAFARVRELDACYAPLAPANK